MHLTKAVKDIIYREDLYPRFDIDLRTIQKYKLSLDQLPAIEINQDNILIDGYHRLKAHESAGVEQIEVKVTEATEREVLKLAIQRNATHGLQLTNKEKRKYANEFIADCDTTELSTMLGVTPRTISKWTQNKRKSLKAERDNKIQRLYLRAWNTQQDIADEVGCDQSTVNRIMQKRKNSDLHKPDDFEPQIYRVWNYSTCNNKVQWPGNIPQDIVEQLLYYYTEPLDTVFDPFAGGGITVDACLRWCRRYWTSDINPATERQEDILEHDITTGLPKGLGQHTLTFLDPPYWKMNRGNYTDKSTDLSNMSLTEFLDTIEMIAKEALSKYLAILISPLQKDWCMTDLTLMCYDRIKKQRPLADRISVPYTTQVHGGDYVNKAKEQQKMLYLVRDLLVFGENNDY